MLEELDVEVDTINECLDEEADHWTLLVSEQTWGAIVNLPSVVDLQLNMVDSFDLICDGLPPNLERLSVMGMGCGASLVQWGAAGLDAVLRSKPGLKVQIEELVPYLNMSPSELKEHELEIQVWSWVTRDSERRFLQHNTRF
ncbi:hypothetical protein DFJ74DRAFT_762720 [Hyaloraphidium curvatum]|nr:hypothetical protein DFJ74DRAFT_762720 [Hyaloraphidium curvatum]